MGGVSWGSCVDPKNRGLPTHVLQALVPWPEMPPAVTESPETCRAQCPRDASAQGWAAVAGETDCHHLYHSVFSPVSPQVSQHYLELGGAVGTGPGPWWGWRLSRAMPDGDRQMHFLIPGTHLIPRSWPPQAGAVGPCLMGRERNKIRIVQWIDAHLCLFHCPESGTCLPVPLSIHPTHSWIRGSTMGPAVTSPLWDNLHG